MTCLLSVYLRPHLDTERELWPSSRVTDAYTCLPGFHRAQDGKRRSIHSPQLPGSIDDVYIDDPVYFPPSNLLWMKTIIDNF